MNLDSIARWDLYSSGWKRMLKKSTMNVRLAVAVIISISRIAVLPRRHISTVKEF